jgi:signal transduction histidine kinase/ligand-binding sensor domain-containing protein
LFEGLACVLLRFRSKRLILACIPVLAAATGSAQITPSAQLASQYVRTDFSIENGLPDNVVDAIVQTANGELWVGTQSGLARFNGREFTAIELSVGGKSPQGAVHALLESSRGDLWAGTDAGVVMIPKAALDRFDPSLPVFYPLGGVSNQVRVITETRRGDIWAGSNHGVFHFDGGKFQHVITTEDVSRISEALNGNLLIIGGGEFQEWDGRRVIHHPEVAAGFHLYDGDIFQVFQDRSGTMWYGTTKGLIHSDHGKQTLLTPGPTGGMAPGVFRIMQDRNGEIWISSLFGVYRVNGEQLDSPAPGLTARGFCLDRDGDLWLGTNGYGMVHLRRRVVRMLTAADGLAVDPVMAVLQTQDGKLWLGGNCGFTEFDGAHFKIYREKDGLLNTCVWSLAEDRNHDLWIGTYGGGLFRMHDGQFTQYTREQGLAGRIVGQILVAKDGSLWISTPEGLSHMQNGHFRNYTTADGLASNEILAVDQDGAGTIWVATQDGVNRQAGDRFVPFPSNRSSAVPLITQFAQDSRGNLFTMESPHGLSLVEGDRLVSVNDDFKVLGMVESPNHDLWFSGKNGITRVGRDDLINAARSHEGLLDYEVFNRSDGMASVQCSVGRPNIALTPDGRLWVATVKGLALINLVDLEHAPKPPDLFVGSIVVGKNKALAGEELRLPPGTNHLELHLEAVDLSSPEKVRIQYRMDGVDPAWLDAGSTQTAVYSNLPQGMHAFHVRASASNGVWNRTGIVYPVMQEPYFYQTVWFRLLAATAFVLLISAIYLLRVRHILRLAQLRMGERIIERERIARELHDTLLQGVLSASMQLDLAEDQIPEDSPAKPLVGRVTQLIRQVTEEGRAALRGLRMHELSSGELPEALLRIPREIGADERINFRVIAKPVARPLRPQTRDEVYRISREAVMNAFIHAKASNIEVEIEYAVPHLRVLVSDNGCGIDPQVLQSGREGHWGLPGMQERAEWIGAVLKVRSRLGAGTEVDLTVPAAIAFEGKTVSHVSHWLSWLSRDRVERTVLNEKK